MPAIKELAELMQELDGLVSDCTRCGVCQSVCPVFESTCLEKDVARGKLSLLDGLIREMFKNSKGVQARLNRCLLCGSCENTCSSGVKAIEVFIKARVILAEFSGLSVAKKVLFQKLLANPDSFDRIFETVAKYQGLFLKPSGEISGTFMAVNYKLLIW